MELSFLGCNIVFGVNWAVECVSCCRAHLEADCAQGVIEWCLYGEWPGGAGKRFTVGSDIFQVIADVHAVLFLVHSDKHVTVVI